MYIKSLPVFRYFFEIIYCVDLQNMFHGLASREKLLLQDPVRAGEDDVKQLPNTSTVSLFEKELPNTKLNNRLLKNIYIHIYILNMVNLQNLCQDISFIQCSLKIFVSNRSRMEPLL